MYEKTNMLNTADKDLICEFVYMSMGRVINKTVTSWDRPVPQGVSVFTAHPESGTFEYMFTKDDKYPVVKDEMDVVMSFLDSYGNVKAGGLVFYLNSCMLPVASKHKQYSY